MKIKKNIWLLAWGSATLIIGLVICFLLIEKISPAELSEKDKLFFHEIFTLNDLTSDLNINGDVVLYIRGEVKGKSFEADYSPEDDPFDGRFCGTLSRDLLSIIRKNHPNISSPSYRIKYYNENKEFRWISINELSSSGEVFVAVGKSGIKSGVSSIRYKLSKIDGKWVSEIIGITMS